MTELKEGAIIDRIETFSRKYLAFVRVTCRDDSIGWGQVSPYNADITAQVLHRQVAPWSLGKSADELAEIVREIPGPRKPDGPCF